MADMAIKTGEIKVNPCTRSVCVGPVLVNVHAVVCAPCDKPPVVLLVQPRAAVATLRARCSANTARGNDQVCCSGLHACNARV
ncbi:hypothetical protein EON67_04855 [archaeon]|nr:MAG: hypothetical protein EON67_04855 [archaeon]